MRATIGNAVIEGTVDEIKALLGLCEEQPPVPKPEPEQRELKPTVEDSLKHELTKHPGKYKGWTRADDEELYKLYNAGNSAAYIARRLHRSVNGIYARVSKLKLWKKAGVWLPYTE